MTGKDDKVEDVAEKMEEKKEDENTDERKVLVIEQENDGQRQEEEGIVKDAADRRERKR